MKDIWSITEEWEILAGSDISSVCNNAYSKVISTQNETIKVTFDFNGVTITVEKKETE